MCDHHTAPWVGNVIVTGVRKVKQAAELLTRATTDCPAWLGNFPLSYVCVCGSMVGAGSTVGRGSLDGSLDGSQAVAQTEALSLTEWVPARDWVPRWGLVPGWGWVSDGG